MLWPRYLGISVLKWISVFAAIVIFSAYVAPASWKGFFLAVPIWILAFALAYLFAFWALHVKIPGRRELITLIAIWMGVTIILQVSYEIFTIGRPVFIIYSLDLYVQYLLEVIAILLAGRQVRAYRMKHALSEGLKA